MFYFILWITLCFLVAMVGTNKNIGYWTTFLISVILSPIIGLIFALASKDKIQVKEYTCKHCGFKTKVNSHFCPACDKDDNGKKKEDYQVNQTV